MGSALERVLDRVGGDDPATLSSKVLAFRRILLAHLAAEAWFRHLVDVPHRGATLSFALLFTMCLAFGWFRRFTRSAGEIVALVAIARVAWAFPAAADHLYLEAIVALMLALFDPAADEENALLMRGLRWLPAIVVFWCGVKKLLAGYYFDGSFFGQMIAAEPRIRELLRPLLDPAEHLRLVRTFWPGRLGDGPYAVGSPLVVAIANATWMLQIALPVGLLTERLRRISAAAIVLLFTIEFALSATFFGALMTALLLLYARRDLSRRLLPLYLVFYVFMLLEAAGLIPRWGLV